ncbi:MAG TPA: S9 family peptidase [Thermoanaerobaculia bacterium]|nr:S9 family peptidase [Thermoanaerobaculia bacterium]
MRFPLRARLAAAAAFLVLVPPLAAASAAPGGPRRPISETDLFQFVWVGDPRISPDGGQVAFVRVAVNAKRDGYDTAIWLASAASGGEPRPLTAGPHDASPRWSPDGRHLAFTRAVRRDGEARPPQLFALSLDGGEARALTDLPRGAGAPVWSPDGKRLAFTSDTSAADLAKKARAKGREKSAGAGDEDERQSDVKVITSAVYRANGEGYLDPLRPSHLWTVQLPAGAADPPPPLQVTRGELSETDPAWSPDGVTLYFTSTRVKEPYYDNTGDSLYSVPAGGGAITRIAVIDGDVGSYALSPDGRTVAFEGVLRGHPERSFDQPDLFVAATAPGSAAPRNLTADFDADIGAGVGGDQHAPRAGGGARPAWTADGKTVIVRAAERGRANLLRIDAASGRVEQLTRGDQEIASYSATPAASRLALVVSTPLALGDLFVLDVLPSAEGMRQLTRFNEPLFSGLALAAPEELLYRSFDGKEIQAWILKPPDFDPRRKYPLILNIHGGPHAAYGYGFFHELQWMAAKGYVVLYPNPRGSSAYGQEFANVIQYHYPGDDFKDLMAGVDELLRRGYVDPRRLGVTGGSGGGLLTNWTITQTDRFAAAVAQRSIADWASWWYTADFTLFTPRWFRGAPWQERADFTARSPISYVDRVKTPLMLIEGEADYRTPPGAGGEAMFRALKYLHKPVVMVRFPGESHELSRSGAPWHRVERLQHIVRWFDLYLEGRKTDVYDVH